MGSLGQLNGFLKAVSDAINGQDIALAKLLFRLDNPQVQQAIFSLSNTTPAQFTGACKRWLQQPWLDITSQHLQALQKRSNGMIAPAFSIYIGPEGPAKKALTALSDNPQSEYMCSIMEQTIGNAEVLAREADAQLMLEGDSSKSKAVGGFLQQCISSLGPSRRQDERGRQRGYLTLLILMTRVYMRLNNVQGCSQVLKNFKQNYSGEVFQTIPAAYRVSAYYYLGRTELNSDNISGGIELLDIAFRECKADSENVKHILRTLIPLKMLQGVLPSTELLQRYGLREYEAFKQAIQQGDVGLFERSMQQNQLRLISNGTYLLLEKLRFLVYRRLLKRVVAVSKSDPGRTWQEYHLPLDIVLGVLHQQQVPLDVDELECLVSNCIVRKFVKGYISNKQKIVVLAKGADPNAAFPEACEDWWRDPQYMANQ